MCFASAKNSQRSTKAPASALIAASANHRAGVLVHEQPDR
jgi:hypothetical protein